MALFSAAFWYPTSFEPFPYHLEYSAVGVPPVRQGVPFVRRGVPLAIFR